MGTTLTGEQVRAMRVFYEALCKRGVIDAGVDPLFAKIDFRDIAEHLVSPTDLRVELKPCPCGSPAKLNMDGRTMVIKCANAECGWSYRQPYEVGQHTYDSVASQWNIRN